jgi:DNA adenine methylase
MVFGLVPRIGGKRYLYKQIINEMAEHDTYVEPFLGSGIVFYNKPPCKVNVVNDLDKSIYEIHAWTKQYGNALGKIHYHLTEDEFYILLNKKEDDEQQELIRRIKVSTCSWMGRPFFSKTTNHEKALHTKDFLYYAQRLKDTLIFNQFYESVIKEYDSPTTLFYLDPPYENSKHTTDSAYESINYDDLLKVILTIKGKFILSINDSPRIRELFKDFIIKDVYTFYPNRNHTKKNNKATELLIKNY